MVSANDLPSRLFQSCLRDCHYAPHPVPLPFVATGIQRRYGQYCVCRAIAGLHTRYPLPCCQELSVFCPLSASKIRLHGRCVSVLFFQVFDHECLPLHGEVLMGSLLKSCSDRLNVIDTPALSI